ncbi:unnamed protein product [Brassica oleracea]
MGMTKLGEKIAAAPPSCYAKEPFLVEERTFFPPLGRSITINAADFGSFTKNNEECDDGSPRILYESGTTRVHRSSGCKINFLRRRRQRLAALEKNRKKLAPAPNKPYGSPRPRIAAYDEPLLSGDKIAPPCVPTEPRFKFTEWREASLFPGHTIKIRNLYDTQNMGNTRVMKSGGNLNDLTSPPPRGILYQTSCIEAKTKSEGLDDEKTSSSLASCIEEITKHVELLKQELEKPYTSTHCLKWADLLFSWIPKTGALPPYEQVSGEGWSVALSRGRAYYMAANDIKGKELTSKQLLDGVPRKHLMSSGGIDRLESTKDFMVSNDYVKDMVVHRRPSHPDEFAGYEILLEKLASQRPCCCGVRYSSRVPRL